MAGVSARIVKGKARHTTLSRGCNFEEGVRKMSYEGDLTMDTQNKALTSAARSGDRTRTKRLNLRVDADLLRTYLATSGRHTGGMVAKGTRFVLGTIGGVCVLAEKSRRITRLAGSNQQNRPQHQVTATPQRRNYRTLRQVTTQWRSV